MNDEIRRREQHALEYAIGLGQQGLSQDEVANSVRQAFGDEVGPVEVAMKAIDEVNKTPKKQPVPPAHQEALKKKIEETMNETKER